MYIDVYRYVSWSMCIHLYIYIYIHVYIYIYIYIYITVHIWVFACTLVCVIHSFPLFSSLFCVCPLGRRCTRTVDMYGHKLHAGVAEVHTNYVPYLHVSATATTIHRHYLPLPLPSTIYHHNHRHSPSTTTCNCT